MQTGAIADHSQITATIRSAAAASSVDFGYLLTQAKLESGLDPKAKAPTSSARGLYQFTAATWLDIVRRHGADHGLGWAATALRDGADPATRTAILALRDDPKAATDMAAALAADNRKSLEQGLGRPATASDLYLAHFLGAAGAMRFLRAEATDPKAAAAGVVPAAARANRSIFYAADGAPRSLAQIHDRFAARFGGTAVPATGTDVPARWASAPPSPAAVSQVRLAYLQLAELGA